MNLFRISSQHVQHVPAAAVYEPPPEAQLPPKPAGATLEGLIAEDSYPQYAAIADHVGENESGVEHGTGAKNDSSVIAKHHDVSDEEGWIAIPYKELPDNWNDAPDIQLLRSMDRSFFFPGEHVHILALLSACKQETEIITPFKLDAAMNKNGLKQSPTKQNGNVEDENDTLSRKGESSLDSQGTDQNGETLSKEKADPQKDVSVSESLL